MTHLLQNFDGLLDGVLLKSTDWELLSVNAQLVHAPLVHGDISDLLEEDSEFLLHVRLRATLEVERRQVVLVLHILVVHLHEHVLFLVLLEILDVRPLVARLLLENALEFLLSFVQIREWSTLVHTFVADATVPCQHNVEFTIGVIDHLHCIERVVSVEAVLEVYLDHVAVVSNAVGVLSLKEDRILLLAFKLLVQRHVGVFVVFNQLLHSFSFGFLQQLL